MKIDQIIYQKLLHNPIPLWLCNKLKNTVCFSINKSKLNLTFCFKSVNFP